MKNQSKDVAFATVVSCDPTQKIEGVQLGREFFMVRVGITLEDDEPLVRPYKNYKVIGDVHGASIAWPSTFVRGVILLPHKILFILNVALTYYNFHCRSRR